MSDQDTQGIAEDYHAVTEQPLLPEISRPQSLRHDAQNQQMVLTDIVSKSRNVLSDRHKSVQPQASGYDALQALRAHHDSQKKNEMLENRIRRLAFEQQRAQKLTDLATCKAEKLLESRERHLQEVEDKYRLQQMRYEENERIKTRNLAFKKQSLQQMRFQKNVVLQQNITSKKQVCEKEEFGYKMRVHNQQRDLTDKRKKVDDSHAKERHFIEFKNLCRDQLEQEVKNNRQEQLNKRQQDIESQNERLSQLALVESYLVEQLGLTQKNQQKALDNLHNVVQICNTQVKPSPMFNNSSSMPLATNQSSLLKPTPSNVNTLKSPSNSGFSKGTNEKAGVQNNTIILQPLQQQNQNLLTPNGSNNPKLQALNSQNATSQHDILQATAGQNQTTVAQKKQVRQQSRRPLATSDLVITAVNQQ